MSVFVAVQEPASSPALRLTTYELFFKNAWLGFCNAENAEVEPSPKFHDQFFPIDAGSNVVLSVNFTCSFAGGIIGNQEKSETGYAWIGVENEVPVAQFEEAFELSQANILQ